jgi:hypothetical protein
MSRCPRRHAGELGSSVTVSTHLWYSLPMHLAEFKRDKLVAATCRAHMMVPAAPDHWSAATTDCAVLCYETGSYCLVYSASCNQMMFKHSRLIALLA